MSSANGNNTFGMWILILLGVLFVIGSLSGGNGSSSAPSSSPSYSSSSPERTYVENRFKQEGYSSADSQKAAEAVLKFHAAQQNRK